MSDEPPILHADLDAFYASVEQRDDPRLRGRPVIVGAGVVLAASYEAKAHGVRTAMNSRQARRMCPDAVIVPPRMHAYSRASAAVFAVFRDITPAVEPLSIDEAFLDVHGLRRLVGGPAVIADRLRARVRDDVGLAITVGGATTKFVAKVASGVAKPDGLLIVPVGAELAFLHPLPVERLWGVGRVTAEKLHQRGLRTVADVAAVDPAALTAMLGAATGRHLHALAHNRDPRPVVGGHRRRSIGAQSALGRRRRTPAELDERLTGLMDRVCRRLRAANRLCRTVTVRLRFDDFTRATRSRSLPEPSSDTAPLLRAARRLLHEAEPAIRERGISLIGVTLANLDDADAVQLELPFGRRDPRTLDDAVDRVRDRYGPGSLHRAALLGKDEGITVPLLPD